MKIVVLGSTGMLGSAVGKYFLKNSNGVDVYVTYRKIETFYDAYRPIPTWDESIHRFYFDPLDQACAGFDVGKDDIVINCIGIIKPYSMENVANTIYINSVFPWNLANYCKSVGAKLIHITTDCVFMGSTGNYDESSIHDATDIYGRSKSLGEPTNCMVLRTSIIGSEPNHKVSLVEWCKSQKGKKVKGFVNCWWNGITTKSYSEICERIIKEDLYQEGVFHVFSSNSLSKYELLHLINDRFSLNLEIEKASSPILINRTLSTVKDLTNNLRIPTIERQVKEM